MVNLYYIDIPYMDPMGVVVYFRGPVFLHIFGTPFHLTTPDTDGSEIPLRTT